MSRSSNRQGRVSEYGSSLQEGETMDSSLEKGTEEMVTQETAGQEGASSSHGNQTSSRERRGRQRQRIRTPGSSRRRERSRAEGESEGENAVSDMDPSAMMCDESSTVPQREVSASSKAPTSSKTKAESERKDNEMIDFEFPVFKDEDGILRVKHSTFVLPICIGSIAFWLGACQFQKKNKISSREKSA